MAAFFAAPLAIVCVYGFLTRGDYGGVEQPWTLENFTRLVNPLYLAVAWRSIWIAALATALCAAAGFPLALFIARAGRLAEESVSPACSVAVLDQLSGPHLCVDVYPARYGTGEHGA